MQLSVLMTALFFNANADSDPISQRFGIAVKLAIALHGLKREVFKTEPVKPSGRIRIPMLFVAI